MKKFQIDYLADNSRTIEADDFLASSEFIQFFSRDKVVALERSVDVKRVFVCTEPPEPTQQPKKTAEQYSYVAESLLPEDQRRYGKGYILGFNSDRGGYVFNSYFNTGYLIYGSQTIDVAIEQAETCSIKVKIHRFDTRDAAVEFLNTL